MKYWIISSIILFALQSLSTERLELSCNRFSQDFLKFIKNFPIEEKIQTLAPAATDLLLDYLFEPFKGKNNPTIGIYYQKAGGLGDVLFANKAANILKAAYPEGKVRVFDAYKIRPHKNREIDDIQIHGPALPYRWGEIDIGIDEYGKETSTDLFAKNNEWCAQENYITTLNSAGLGACELGIFLDDDLWHYAWLSQFVPKERLYSELSQLENSDLKQFLTNDSVHYFKTQGLYFGYGHREESALNFIKYAAVFHAHEEQNHNLDIVLPVDYKKVGQIYKGLIENANKFKKLGYNKIELFRQDDQRSEFRRLFQITLLHPGKCIRIILSRRLSHKDMITLIKVSASLTLATGDQSMGESISAAKLPLYEVLGFKQDFANSFSEVAKQYSLKIGKLIAPLVSHLADGNLAEREALSQNIFEEADEVYTLWKENKKLYHKFLNDIFVNRNIHSRLVLKVRRTLMLKSYSVLNKWVNEVRKSTFHPEDHDRILVPLDNLLLYLGSRAKSEKWNYCQNLSENFLPFARKKFVQ